MRRYRRSMRRRRCSMWRRLRLGQRRRRSRGGHSMRRYRRSMRRRRRWMRRRWRSARRRWRSAGGDCGVGITPQMCNRVTNHGDMSTFSKPGNAATPWFHERIRMIHVGMKQDLVNLSRWCIFVHNKKLWTIVLGIGTKQEWIPRLATTSIYI